jgi:transposase
MPAKNHLNPKQIEKLQKALKEEEKGNIRAIILILILLNDGKMQSKIAEFLGFSVNKVSYWCLKGDPDYLESLIDESLKGNHKKATEKYIEILL